MFPSHFLPLLFLPLLLLIFSPLSNTSITNFMSGKRISISSFPSPYTPLSRPLSPLLCLFASTTHLCAPLWHIYNYVVSWNDFSLFLFFVSHFSPLPGPFPVSFAVFIPICSSFPTPLTFPRHILGQPCSIWGSVGCAFLLWTWISQCHSSVR